MCLWRLELLLFLIEQFELVEHRMFLLAINGGYGRDVIGTRCGYSRLNGRLSKSIVIATLQTLYTMITRRWTVRTATIEIASTFS